MNSRRISERAWALAAAVMVLAGASACDDKQDPPERVTPPAGVLQPSDLMGSPAPKVLGQDETLSYACGSTPESDLDDNSESRYIVEYKLDDQTVVRSSKYTYAVAEDRDEDIAGLRSGISGCVAAHLGDGTKDSEKFTAVPGLPGTAAGYDVYRADPDGGYRIGERIWASQGAEGIVSVTVLYQGDQKIDKLPADAKQLALEVAARQ
ncbi:hypothetical protein AB0I34_03680 [Kribbella sp. NPDC050281]|uniref:hypothetical protein n=1 Tax=Kribbella sp. NPDC050281 TaxID=3155515 RepID=UPI0033C2D4DF